VLAQHPFVRHTPPTAETGIGADDRAPGELGLARE
jgi:hypothetical protein